MSPQAWAEGKGVGCGSGPAGDPHTGSWRRQDSQVGMLALTCGWPRAVARGGAGVTLISVLREPGGREPFPGLQESQQSSRREEQPRFGGSETPVEQLQGPIQRAECATPGPLQAFELVAR